MDTRSISSEERWFLTVTEFAKKTGLARSTAYDLVKRGLIPCVYFGSVVRIPVDDLLTWIEKHTHRAA